MKFKFSMQTAYRGGLVKVLMVTLSVVMAGCASSPVEPPPAPPEVVLPKPPKPPMSPLEYYQLLSRMTLAELGRERMVLNALPKSPNTQVRMAMLLGFPRAPQDLSRAIALLDGVLKSTDPEAIGLQALARLLADSYAERQKLDASLGRQEQQLKESQRKVIELQEKIDDLADIERTLPQRPRAGRSSGSGSSR